MNRKQLRISLFVFGLFAIIVICIGLVNTLNGGTVQTLTAEQQDMVNALENVGTIDVDDIKNFKDGVYVPGRFSNDIFSFEKEGNVLRIYATGNGVLQGNSELVAAAKVLKEYEGTTLYSLGGVDFKLEQIENGVDIRKIKVSKLIKEAKSGTLSYRFGMIPDIATFKVVKDGEVLWNDNLFVWVGEIEEKEDETSKKQVDSTSKDGTTEGENTNTEVENDDTAVEQETENSSDNSEDNGENTGTETSESTDGSEELTGDALEVQ